MKKIKLSFLFTLLLSLSIGYSNSNSTVYPKNLNTMDCESLDRLVQEIYDDGQLGRKEVAEITPSLYNIIQLKECNSLGSILNLMGFLYYSKGDFHLSQKYLREAESILIESPNRSVYGKNQLFLGLCYRLDDNSQSAILYFEKAKQTYITLNDSLGICDTKLNIGQALYKLGKVEEAQVQLTSALNYFNTDDAEEIKGYILQNLALVFQKMGKQDEAIVSANQAEQIWREIGYDIGLYYTQIIKAEIYNDQGNIQNEIIFLEKAKEISENLAVDLEKENVYVNLAKAYAKINKQSKVIEMHKKSVQYMDRMDNEDIQLLMDNLIPYYLESNNQQAIQELNDKLLSIHSFNVNAKQNESVERKQNENDLTESLAENKQLQTDNILNKEKIHRQNHFITIMALTSLVLLTFLYIIYRQNSTKQDLLNKLATSNKKLKETNQKLEDSYLVITEQNTELEIKNQDLTNFAATASHDLKSPARTIMSFAGLLMKKLGDRISENEKSLLQGIEQSGKDMHELTSDLLEFSKIHDKTLHFEEIDPMEIIEQVQFDLDANIKEANARIDTAGLPQSIFADKIKIKMVFQNLISNAIKFSKKGQEPNIKIRGFENTTHYNFVVEDNGIGIKEEYQEKVFGMFEKLHSSNEYQGTGIGLATVAKVTNLHKGGITLESELGHGSTFTFSIAKSLRPG